MKGKGNPKWGLLLAIIDLIREHGESEIYDAKFITAKLKNGAYPYIKQESVNSYFSENMNIFERCSRGQYRLREHSPRMEGGGWADSKTASVAIPERVSERAGRVEGTSFTRIEDLFCTEEVTEAAGFVEGAVHTITVNAYERNPQARRLCIEHYGATCSICGFNFEAAYGDVAEGHIHVHHVKPLSEIGEEYEVDPVADLRPVCANCHAVIHRGRECRTIEQVRHFLEETDLGSRMVQLFRGPTGDIGVHP